MIKSQRWLENTFKSEPTLIISNGLDILNISLNSKLLVQCISKIFKFISMFEMTIDSSVVLSIKTQISNITNFTDGYFFNIH